MHTRTLALISLAGLALAAPAPAQTNLSGQYNNHAGDGYDEAAMGDYVVAPSATFNGNSPYGLLAQTTGTTTVQGGSFDNNTFPDPANGNPAAIPAGLYAKDTTVVVKGGDFSNNRFVGSNENAGPAELSAVNSTVTVDEGTFSGSAFNEYGLYATNSTVTINGGTFDETGAHDLDAASSAVTINGGTFNGPGGSNNFAVSVTCINGDEQPLTITGGTFNESVQASFLDSLNITGGQFSGGVIASPNTYPDPAIYTISGGQFHGAQFDANTLTVTGGTFQGNVNGDGLSASGVHVLISGGTSKGNSIGLELGGVGASQNSRATITGGDFAGNTGFNLRTYTDTSIYGGQFGDQGASKPEYDLVMQGTASTVTVYGTFGQYGVFTNSNLFDPSYGSFTGTLAYDSAPQTIRYRLGAGDTLILAPAPEPTALAGLALGASGLGAMALKSRARARRRGA